jgi:PKD repeat protein
VEYLALAAFLVSTGGAWAVCTVTGDFMIDCDGVVYRAVDDECVHYVNLAAHNAAHPGVTLPDLKKRMIDNYDAAAVPAPVVVELTDHVDCTQTSHNFAEANLCSVSPHPNQPSRLMNISGRTFRVTAAPDDGFATYYYSYDMATGGTAGVPHLLVAESSNDQERYTSLAIHHPDGIVINPGQPWAPPYTGEPTINPWGDPWWEQNPIHTQEGSVFGPDVGLAVYTGRELPIDNQPFNISMVFHAKTATARVVVSSLGCNLTRSGTDGGAVSRMWVFRFVDEMSARYPAMVLPGDPGSQRRVGVYMTHPWYFYAHHGTPVRTLAHRQTELQRMVQHFKYCGFNYIAFNAINGSDRSGKAWYNGSAHFPWNSAGDLLAELPPIAQAEGIQLVPIITSLTVPTYSGGLTFSNTSYQLGTDNDYTRAFGSPTLDPLRPEVQQLTQNLLSEIATRCASNPSVRGIGIRVNGKIGTCYTSDDDGSRGARLSGYSSWDLQQFRNATGSGVPTSPPGTAYNWLTARPAEWESWINWRCQKTREFWLACRDLIKTYRSDLMFCVQCDLPSETPGTNIEWASGETPYNLLRHHGYDPNLFVNDTGIVISRGMMVAEDRFYVSTRWGSPWGSNSDNYRLFHFAPGLAELYRTAAGRACEMYQNYWEETFNPYWEFGSCGDPNGFFRTHTPAAPGRAFFAGATMGLRRQDPDTITWLGWNRPTLGHEADLRKFAQAFRALPMVTPTAFNGTIDPAIDEVVARWHGDRLAVINDTSSARTITLHFARPVTAGYELTDLVTGRKLVTANQIERQHLSFSAEAYSLTTFFYAQATPAADFTTDALPSEPPLTVQFHDASTATNITAWAWDFGDGSSGSGPNPQHTYAGFGTYDVTLTITADGGQYARTKPVSLASVRPVVADESPARGAVVGSLSYVSVTFSKTVTGVDAGDLTINGSGATTLSGSGAGPYVFGGFAQPGIGKVPVSLGPGGIQDLTGTPFSGDSWTYTIPSPPVPGVSNPSFEDSGGSYNGWEIVWVSGEGPDNPPLDNTNRWGPRTTFGTHFGGKITNGLKMDFYLGQVVGTGNWKQAATTANWQLNAYVQLHCTHENNPNPSGVHQVWEIGWMNDGSEPANISSCDHYQVVASIDGTYTGNDKVNFYPLSASGTVTGVTGLRGLAVRAHLFNDSSWWWTMANIDNLAFSVTSVPPPPIPADLDGDGDVDVADYELFADCATSPGLGPPPAGCDTADLDSDKDVDQGDFGMFQRCVSGAGVPGDSTCAAD